MSSLRLMKTAAVLRPSLLESHRILLPDIHTQMPPNPPAVAKEGERSVSTAASAATPCKSSPGAGFDAAKFDNVFANDLRQRDGTPKEALGAFLRAVSTVLSDYVLGCTDRSKPVVNFKEPSELADIMHLGISSRPSPLSAILADIDDAIKYSVQTQHPRFYNQLFAGTDVVALVGEWVTCALNASMYTYEVAPAFTLVESTVLAKMRAISGLPVETGDGIFSPGGSVSNLYAMQAARHKACPETKKRGLAAAPNLVAFASTQCHYSVQKAAAILGFGTDAVIAVECDAKGRMDPFDLEKKMAAAENEGLRPFFVNATSGTTVLGAFDPLDAIADICERHEAWMHVDGAWGGSVLLSSRHRALMTGISRADSLTWNPHKMLGVPLQCSAVLLREDGILKACNSMKAQYLFQTDKKNGEFDTGDKALQCGRKVDAFKLWLAWKARGDDGYAAIVDAAFDRAAYLVESLRRRVGTDATGGFRLVVDRPQFTNVCFWYEPAHIRCLPDTYERRVALHTVAPLIKARMQARGTAMVGFQPLGDMPNFFRMVISNPNVTNGDMDALLDEIDEIGRELPPPRTVSGSV